MNDLISIIIPVYNVEKYLKKCLDSVINQTYENLEIILVDDGSSDQSPNICDEYAQKDSRIKVIHQKNYGQAHARNRALDIMQGDWVTFIDSDDFVSIYYVENLYNLAKKYSTKIAFTSCKRVYNQNFTPNSFKSELKAKFHRLDLALCNIFRNKFYGPGICSKIFSASLFENERFKNGKIYEDLDLIPKLMHKIGNRGGVAYANQKDYYYFKRANSTMNEANFSQKHLVIFEILDDFREFFKSDKNILNAINHHEAHSILRALIKSKVEKKYINLFNEILNKNAFYFIICLDMSAKMKFILAKLLIYKEKLCKI
ncbi:glycosyltransferase family 2 protein [Campylobacter sp. FMV-PI01]|uniref:Glycosyltransferase family 2 protein n=1 Tax=Campylobacter portucalensis TaxID=2608384 RepID=A0A6L5WG90_9BACT|nr:glycosyltransferase family 2 protein [Campylobacter portucalensis]MSN96170.1 glycosyltransferase family 2 protein [Campylobacter portucalensis]